MGLFNKLGRKAEQFKRQVEDAAEETTECPVCGAEYVADYDACPECGRTGDDERVEDESADGSAEEAAAGEDPD